MRRVQKIEYKKNSQLNAETDYISFKEAEDFSSAKKQSEEAKETFEDKMF